MTWYRSKIFRCQRKDGKHSPSPGTSFFKEKSIIHSLSLHAACLSLISLLHFLSTTVFSLFKCRLLRSVSSTTFFHVIFGQSLGITAFISLYMCSYNHSRPFWEKLPPYCSTHCDLTQWIHPTATVPNISYQPYLLVILHNLVKIFQLEISHISKCR